MSKSRLKNLEEEIQGWQEQIAGIRTAIRLDEEKDRVRLQQNIKHIQKTYLKPLEEEYWALVGDLVTTEADLVSDNEAEPIVAEIIEVTPTLQTSEKVSAEMLVLLQKIYAEVSKPGVTASAKLKGVISSIPPFIGVSYEGELDTEQFIKKYFPTFRGWVKALVKK